MSHGRLWMLGLQEQAAKEQGLKAELAAKHRRIMFCRKRFLEIFKADVKRFYKDIYTGFDQMAFDDYLMTQDDDYGKANEGLLGDDVDCSMETHITNKYGAEAASMVRRFIGI